MAGHRRLTFLGTGTSVGVPMIGCECPVCTSTDPRNQRMRSSVLIDLPAGRLLVDTTPELRLQLLRAKVPLVHAVLYTHYHVDHLFGLDDLRVFPRHLGGPLPLFCTDETEAIIRSAFPYAFAGLKFESVQSLVPQLEFRRIAAEPFEALGERVVPIPFRHGTFNVLGFRMGDIAYCTDVSHVPDESWPLLEGLDVLVLSALRYKPHPTHLNLDQALAVIARVKPRQAYLTHLAHDMDHATLLGQVPENVAPAYDGLSFPF